MFQYMHLIDGKPAYFDGHQILAVAGEQEYATLVSSLDAIYRNEQQTIEYRQANNCLTQHTYSCIPVKVADDDYGQTLIPEQEGTASPDRLRSETKTT